MNPGLIIHLGQMADVQVHFDEWRSLFSQGDTNSGVVLVPTSRLCQALHRRLPEASNIMVLDDWIEQFLPQNITRAPWGTWHILSPMVPVDVIDADIINTPGARSVVLQYLHEMRKSGMRSTWPPSSPWASLVAWYDEKFQHTIADELRMYEWAQEFLRPSVRIGIYGFSEWSSAQWRMIETWALFTEVHVWQTESLWDTTRDQMLSHQTAVTHVPSLSEPGRCRAVLSPDEEPLDLVAHTIYEQKISLDEAVFCSIDDGHERAIVRSLVRERVLDPRYRERSHAEVLWELFLIVAEGRAREVVKKQWCTAIHQASDANEWAKNWWERITTVSDWREVARLIQEAIDFHHQAHEWAPLLAWARSAAVFVEWSSIPAMGSLLGRLGKELLAQERALILLPPEEAVWVSGRYRVLFGVGQEFPRRPTRIRFGTASHQGPLLFNHHRHDVAILEDLTRLPGCADVLLRDLEDGGDLSFDQIIPVVHEDRQWYDGDQDRVLAWYESWRVAKHYTAYTGLLDQDTVGPLLPEYFSPSALETFGRCPLSFLLQRLLRVTSVSEPGMELEPRLIGQWAHRTMELMMQDKTGLSKERVSRWVSAAIEENPPPRTVPVFHIRYQQERLSAELFEALMRDQNIPVTASQAEVDLQWDTLWPMHGRLDRVDTLSDGTLRIIDYKTGVLSNPNRVTPTSLQLALYEEALREQTGRSVSAELMGISQRSQFLHRSLDPTGESARRQQLMTIQHGMKVRIQAGQFFPAPNTGQDPCRQCDYRTLCPARVRDYSADKIVEYPEYQSLWKGESDEEVPL